MTDLQVYWETIGGFRYGVALLGVLFVGYLYCMVRELYVVWKTSKLPEKGEEDGVSVIITSHNNSVFLKRNLPSFLMQEYSNYEVIVVDECSEDDTQEVLAEIQREYPRLRFTRIYPGTKFRYTKKLAINIGVLAAQHDILLFSEATCRPASLNWVREMQRYFDKETAVILGLANYDERERDVCWKRYFRFRRFWKMLLLVRGKQNILGDGCNMAYRKSYYLKNRGFTVNSQAFLGYDNDMVTELSKFGQVKVVKDPCTYMIVDKNERERTVDEVSYYFASKIRWSVLQRLRADIHQWIRLGFYGVGIYLWVMGIFVKPLAGVLLCMFLLDIALINICARYLKQGGLFMMSVVEGLIGFGYRGYWNVYSFFNQRKWR